MKQSKTVKRVTAEELDQKMERGEDLSDYFDMDAATKKVNLDIPVWALKELDREANRRGVARQALLKMWITDRLDAIREKKASA